MADLNDRGQRCQAVAVALLRFARYIGMDPEAALDWAEKGDDGGDEPAFVAARQTAKDAILRAAGHNPQDPGQIDADLVLTGAWRALLAIAVEGAIGTDRQPAEVIEQAMDRITWPGLTALR